MKLKYKDIQRFIKRFTLSHTITLGILSALVGLLSGAGVWLFKWLFESLRNILFDRISPQFPWLVVLIPIAGGLVVGLMVQYFIGGGKLHGTANIMQSVAISGGRLPYRKMPVNTLAAILSIGTGASVGPEDPSVQIGANFGSVFGQIFHLPDERTRTLVAAGAASAIAAAFNAPIAGVFFALEIVLGEISGNSLSMILVSAVTSAVFTQAVSGTQPAFQIPTYTFHSAWELPLYLLLGLLAGPISALYVRLLYKMQDVSGSWKAPGWIKPAVAGILVGLVGLFLPQVFGVGYETISGILNSSSYSIPLLCALLAAKLILTPISIGGGFVGGVFAPSLFVGDALGGLFGGIAAQLFPGLGIDAAAFSLVGMAAVLAGAVHAPLTASLLLFEMTGDYRIILPLLFAVAISLMVSQRIQRDSVYEMGLARHGIRLDRGQDIEVLSALTVGEVMRTNLDALEETLPVHAAAETLAKNRRHGLPVVDSDHDLVGVLTLGDIDRAMEEGKEDETVGTICTRNLVTTTPDEALASALRRMSHADLGRLPVVATDNPSKLVGMLRRADVIHAYEIALTRRTTLRHHMQSVRLDTFTPSGMEVSEVIVEPGSEVDGRLLKEVPFPHDCVIASVQRGAEIFIPRGDTLLLGNDILVVVAERTAYDQVNQICVKNET